MAELLNTTVYQLQRWDKNGVLKALRTPNGQRYYTFDQYFEFIGFELSQNQVEELHNGPKSLEKIKEKIDEILASSDLKDHLSKERAIINIIKKEQERNSNLMEHLLKLAREQYNVPLLYEKEINFKNHRLNQLLNVELYKRHDVDSDYNFNNLKEGENLFNPKNEDITEAYINSNGETIYKLHTFVKIEMYKRNIGIEELCANAHIAKSVIANLYRKRPSEQTYYRLAHFFGYDPIVLESLPVTDEDLYNVIRLDRNIEFESESNLHNPANFAELNEKKERGPYKKKK